MEFKNKKTKGVPYKNLIPDFHDSRWIQDTKVLGTSSLSVDGENPHKAELTITESAQGRLISIPVETGKTYTFSFGNITGLYRLLKGRTNTYNNIPIIGQDSKRFTFTVTADYYGYVTLRITHGLAGTYLFENLQLVEGSVATPFAPYKELPRKSKLVPKLNLVKPFKQWLQTDPNASIIGNHEAVINPQSNYKGFRDNDLSLKVGGTYTFSIEEITENAVIFIATIESGTTRYTTLNSNKKTATFTISPNVTGMWMEVHAQTYRGNFKFKNPMLVEGSVLMPFEQYEEVSRKAVLVPKKNLLNSITGEGWRFSNISESTVISNYEFIIVPISGAFRSIQRDMLSVKPNQTYTLSGTATLGTGYLAYDVFDKAGNKIDTYASPNGQESITFTTLPTAYVVSVRFASRLTDPFGFKDLQFEEGSTSTSFSPYELAPKKVIPSVTKATYKDYPFTFKRESIEQLNGTQYGFNNPRFKDGGLFIEEGLTNTVSNSDKVQELKTVGTYYGQVTYNHGLPKGGVVQSTDDKYTLQFELKKIGKDSRPFVSVVVGAQPPKDSWSWRLFEYDFHEGIEIVDLEDGWQRYTKTFTIKGTKGEYLQTFIKFICEVRDVDIDSLIRNVQIEERDYATTYTTGYRKHETAVANIALDKYAGSIETEFTYKDIASKSQYIFDSNPNRWILYKDAWDNQLYVYIDGNAVIQLDKSVLPEGRVNAKIVWGNGEVSLTLNGVKVGTNTYTSTSGKFDRSVYLGSRYTGVEHLNNVIHSFKVTDRTGNVTYKI
jgi:hypothetical protein